MAGTARHALAEAAKELLDGGTHDSGKRSTRSIRAVRRAFE